MSLELDLPPLLPKISKRSKVSIGSAFGGLKEKTTQLISTKPINVTKAEDSVRTKKRKVSRRVKRNRIIALLILLGVIFGGYQLLGVGKISVPSLVGMSQNEAKEALSNIGLLSEVVEEVFSEDIAQGKVISSSPGGGGRISPAGTVGLVLSKGQERIEIPVIANLTPDVATQKISALGLTIGDINEVFDMKVESGFVIGTDPKSGEKVKRNSVVNIVVSKGIEKIALISYVGKGGDEALSELTNSGFDVKVVYKFSDKVFKGQVVSQSPEISDAIGLGSKIELVLSKGPEFVFVPNVLGKNKNDASLDLENLGLKVVTKGTGKVNNISPAIGTKVKQGAVITLTLR
jgi:serine/threonine-protein kinase